MADDQTDRPVLATIKRLADEEHHLYEKSEISEAERERLRIINIELDQCWDLLRQRRALREFGDDPAAAKLRPSSVVEKYEG